MVFHYLEIGGNFFFLSRKPEQPSTFCLANSPVVVVHILPEQSWALVFSCRSSLATTIVFPGVIQAIELLTFFITATD